MTKTLKFRSAILCISLAFFALSCNKVKTDLLPLNTTISEGLTNPLGFYDDTPTFSWELPTGVQSQSAYSIVVASSPDLLPNKADLWQSGKIKSDQTIFVKYKGLKLSSKQKVYWQVKFWDNASKPSEWSKVSHFELGLLSNNDWKGKWIAVPPEELNEIGRKKAVLFRPQYLRKEINIDSKVLHARLYITAKGVYEAYLNGQKVGTDIMSPGWTPYTKSISTLTYDVTEMLNKGTNTLGAVLAQGWYSGRIGLRRAATKEDAPFLLCQLEIETENGKQTIVTDKTWKVTLNGPIRKAEIYDGETYDANFELTNWNTNNFNDSKWLSVIEQELEDSILLLPKRYQGVRAKDTLNVQAITVPEMGKSVFDFGQNNVGVPLINVPMKKGDTLTVRFAEMLDTNGTLFTKNYRSALSTNHYIAAKDGIVVWQPTFTFHGYRYIELSGFDSNATPQNEWIKAIVQYSDFEWNGTFTSSHKKLNQLQSNITWGLKSNFYDVPTDCPQRDERLGWTGDAQVIAPTSIYNASMYAFWAGWLQSVRQEQMADGGIPFVVPNNLGEKTSSGWGDACVIIPWELYYRTGDIFVLEENYSMMTKWLDFYASKANNHIVRMHSFADWLQPYPQPKDNERAMRRGDTPKDFISTAYYARSVELTLKSALALGKKDDAKRLETLHQNIKDAFENKFFEEDGRVSHSLETQTQYLLAIKFGLLSAEKEKKAIAHLIRVIEECDNHLRTGFLGTPVLPFVLDEVDNIDLMYEILFKETYPSWFYSINQGATTMWERWDSYTLADGFNKGGMNSFNHYAYGAIGQWMYERIAGIKPLKAGYKEILIAPIPGGPLTSAEASYKTPYGKVSSAWEISNNKFKLETTIPPNTIAKIVIPANTTKELNLNGKPFGRNQNIELVNKGDSNFELRAQPGTYVLESELRTN